MTTSQPNHAAPTAPAAHVLDDGAPAPDFETVYAEHFGYVWHVLRRLGGRDRDLEDLAHDVFVIVYRALDAYDPSRPIRPWLFGIAFRVVSDYRRKASFRREVPHADREVHDPRPSAHELVEAREARAVVHEALEALPLEQRAVFVMHELEGHSIPEIATGLDISLNTLYSRLRLARKRFTDAVRDLQARRGKP